MQAVILAGGKGSRLAAVTGDLPKPMVPLAGRPLLEHQIRHLVREDIRDIVLVVGPRAESITGHFSDGAAVGARIEYYQETAPLGTAGALPKLRDRLEETFLLIYGDVYFDLCWEDFLAFHTDRRAACSLLAHPSTHPEDSDLLTVEDDGRVVCWSPKPTEGEARTRRRSARSGEGEEQGTLSESLCNAGLYILEKRFLERLPAQDVLDLEKDLLRPQLAKERIFAYRSAEFVRDIGTPERYAAVQAMLSRNA